MVRIEKIEVKVLNLIFRSLKGEYVLIQKKKVMEPNSKSYFYKISRVIFFLIIIYTLSVLNYDWNTDFYKRYNFKTIEKAISYQLNSELENQIDELNAIKQQLENELKDIEEQRVELIKDLEDAQETLEDQFNKLYYLANKTIYTEKTLTSNQKQIYSEQPCSTLDNCFDYSKCKLNSKISIYIYQNNNLNLSVKSVDDVYEVVDSVQKSCLVVYIATDKDSGRDFLKNIGKYKGDNYNLLIINLAEDYNLFNDSYSIQFNKLNDLKCSLYSSFIYYKNNEIFKSRYNNLFFHFSLIKTIELNKFVNTTYENQQQNGLLLTNKRDYLLSYYQMSSKKLLQKFRKIKSFNEINCNASQIKCQSGYYRYEILSSSTFLLLNNDNIKNFVLWSDKLTYRLIEALSVGTIPLILDLDSVLPLNDLINWEQVIIRLPIKQVDGLELILNNMNEADIISRRIQATKIYNRYFKTREIQFNTLITAIRERIRLPATPIQDYIDDEVDKYPQIITLNVNMSIYKDESTQINDEEFLGPVSNNGMLEQRKPYDLKVKFYDYFTWNVLFYPFNIMPTSPFDKFSPIDLKYSSIEEQKINDTNYFYGGSNGGQYFNEKLGGNYDDNEQFTMVILTFNRERLLISTLLEYFKMPFLNQIIIVWNSVHIPPTNSFYYIFRNEFKSKLIRVVMGRKNSLGNRFLPYDFIRTEAVIAFERNISL